MPEPNIRRRESKIFVRKRVVMQTDREKMIAEAAYFRAMADSSATDPLKNWLEAEKEVDRQLEQQQRKARKEDVAAFEKLRLELSKILDNIQDTVRAETFKQALDKAIDEVKGMGKYTAESVGKGAEALKKDIVRNMDKYKESWPAISGKATDVFDVWRERSAHFLKQAGEAADSWLKQVRGKHNPHLYHTGELTSAGTFVCSSCGHTLQVGISGHLPPCPNCQQQEFKRES